LNDLKLQTDQLNAQKSRLIDNLSTNSTALKKLKADTQNMMLRNEHYRKEINSLLKTVTQSNVSDYESKKANIASESNLAILEKDISIQLTEIEHWSNSIKNMEILTKETQLKMKQLSTSLSEKVDINSESAKKLRIKQNDLTLLSNEIKKLENEKFKLNQKLGNLNDSVIEIDTKCVERLNSMRNDLNTSHIKMSYLNFGTSKHPDVLTTSLGTDTTITAFTINELDVNKYGNSK